MMIPALGQQGDAGHERERLAEVAEAEPARLELALRADDRRQGVRQKYAASAAYNVAAVIPGCACQHCAEAAQVTA